MATTSFKVCVSLKNCASGILEMHVERESVEQALEYVALDHYGEKAKDLNIWAIDKDGKVVNYEHPQLIAPNA